MPRDRNIYYNLVYDENSVTELLCNLMRIAVFRRALLSRLFALGNVCEVVPFDDIDTQCRTADTGQPDVTIDSKEVYGFIKVKIRSNCGLTQYQPDGYLEKLSNDKRGYRFLAFLVPPDWEDRRNLDDRLKNAKSDARYRAVETAVITWEDVLDEMEKNELQTLDLALQDFHRLMEGWFRPKPIRFTRKEIEMLYSVDALEGLLKLQQLINNVSDYSQREGFKADWESRERTLVQTAYGFYLDESQLLYFGMDRSFWKLTGSPLCFAANNGNEVAKEKFLRACADRKIWTLDDIPWTGISFGKEDLESEEAAQKIWVQIKPVAEAVLC